MEVFEMIDISDKNLLREIEKEINPPSLRRQELTSKMIQKIKYLNLSRCEIKSLKGIEYCRNIEVLYLIDNKFEDISPLTELQNLELLDLSMNPQIDWSTLTKSLNSVKYLYLRSCELPSDLVLRFFPNVRQVSLYHNNISKVESLYNLKQLDSVDLSHNKVTSYELNIFINKTGVGIMKKQFASDYYASDNRINTI